MKKLKVLYAGCPEYSALCLNLLVEKSKTLPYSIEVVLTHEAARMKNSNKLVDTPVSSLASSLSLPVIKATHITKPVIERIKKFNPDILVCFSHGNIYGPVFLSLFNYQGLNLHPSALPKYRGPSPVTECILQGDISITYSVQLIEQKMDSGDILESKTRLLKGNETTGELLEVAAKEGSLMLSSILTYIANNKTLPPHKKQDGDPSYTKKVTKEDARLNFNLSAAVIDRVVRAYNPSPISWTFLPSTPSSLSLRIYQGEPLSYEKVKESKLDAERMLCTNNFSAPNGMVIGYIKERGLYIKCQDSFYIAKVLQKAGKKVLEHKAYMNGERDIIGKTLL